MVQFPRFASYTYGFSIGLLIKSVRLPHSDTPGLSLIVSSPRLFADCRVLLRLSSPRHPPDALTSLDSIISRTFST